MNRVLDRLAHDRGAVAVALGLLLGLAVTQQPLLVPLAVVGAAVALGCLAWPPAMIGLIFVSILFDKLGVTGVDVARFPITASKLAVLGSLGLWTVHVLLTRARPLRWHPVLSAMLACVAATGITVAIAGSMKHGRFALLGLAMMTVMVALVYAVLAERALQTFFRLLGLAWTAALAASLAGGRGGAGEAARATGTFGDPNEWATKCCSSRPSSWAPSSMTSTRRCAHSAWPSSGWRPWRSCSRARAPPSWPACSSLPACSGSSSGADAGSWPPVRVQACWWLPS